VRRVHIDNQSLAKNRFDIPVYCIPSTQISASLITFTRFNIAKYVSRTSIGSHEIFSIWSDRVAVCHPLAVNTVPCYFEVYTCQSASEMQTKTTDFDVKTYQFITSVNDDNSRIKNQEHHIIGELCVVGSTSNCGVTKLCRWWIHGGNKNTQYRDNVFISVLSSMRFHPSDSLPQSSLCCWDIYNGCRCNIC
jgi:hypothetical protein